MTNEDLISRATAGEGGAWTWEALVEELSRRLRDADIDSDCLAMFIETALPGSTPRCLANHRDRLEADR